MSSTNCSSLFQALSEIRNMEHNAREQHENICVPLEAQIMELLRRKKDLETREIERATLERKKAVDNILRLAKDQEMEKETHHDRILEIESMLDAKQQLELEMKGNLQEMKQMGGRDLEYKMEQIQLDLKEKEEDLIEMEKLCQTLIVKEREINQEVQDACMELVNALKEVSGCDAIGVKKMGQLETGPFVAAIKRKYPDEEEADEKAIELLNLWEDYLRDSTWHPFKIITSEGNTKEVVDEDDEKLKELRSEFGEELFKTVATALLERNTYNPCGRYVVPVLWNFKGQRKAKLQEGVAFLVQQWKHNKKI